MQWTVNSYSNGDKILTKNGGRIVCSIVESSDGLVYAWVKEAFSLNYLMMKEVGDIEEGKAVVDDFLIELSNSIECMSGYGEIEATTEEE